jgi:hypothetical protein
MPENILFKEEDIALEPLPDLCFRDSLLQTKDFREKVRKVIHQVK